jgi:gas vesicle protein
LIIKWILGFVISAAVGAAAALLLAPSSGQELRIRLSEEMAAKRQQLEADSEAMSQEAES